MKHHIKTIIPAPRLRPQLPYLSTRACVRGTQARTSLPHEIRAEAVHTFAVETPFRSYTLPETGPAYPSCWSCWPEIWLAPPFLVRPGECENPQRTSTVRTTSCPNGMQFQEVYNLQASYATTPGSGLHPCDYPRRRWHNPGGQDGH